MRRREIRAQGGVDTSDAVVLGPITQGNRAPGTTVAARSATAVVTRKSIPPGRAYRTLLSANRQFRSRAVPTDGQTESRTTKVKDETRKGWKVKATDAGGIMTEKSVT